MCNATKKAKISSSQQKDISTSSLHGSPTCSLVPPGKCQFSDNFTSVKLLERWTVSPTSAVFRFGLPDKSKPLNLSTCACILARAEVEVEDGKKEEVVRPYTPISTNEQIGSFDLLVKNYGKHGKMSRHMHGLKIDDTIDFKHIDKNVKIQAPFSQKHIGMIAGGTGITPMVQALHAILGSDEEDKKVTLLYGSKIADDILGYEMLEKWERDHKGRLDVTHVLSDEKKDSDWEGKRGFIDKELIKEKMPSPDKGGDAIIFVCGPKPMYDVFCGPREEKELKGLLKEMGYDASQVNKF